MSRIFDDEGTALVRTRDGDLVPDQEPSRSPAPSHHPDAPCGDHGDLYGYRAASCPACWSEIKAGDRPHRMLGLVLDGGCDA